MALDLSPFAHAGLDRTAFESLMGEHDLHMRPSLERLWSYYRNPQTPASATATWATLQARSWGGAASGGGQGRAYRLAQEVGLPARLIDLPTNRRETVIENDIAWRIDALADFAFGRPPRLSSTADDPMLRALIDAAVSAAWESAGGHALLLDLATLGLVYGYSDLVLRTDRLFHSSRSLRPIEGDDPSTVAQAARLLSIEIVEPTRSIPFLDPGDYRSINAYIIRSRLAPPPAAHTAERSALGRVFARVRPGTNSSALAEPGETVEILTARHRRVWIGGKRVLDEPNPLGMLPVVHIQNNSQPFRYEGLSDVEPLIPLQDELNTRLSDRAHRVTMQSFNMYLAKGLDQPTPTGTAPAHAVAPGQVWFTDNTDADIKSFGGDGHSPSEDRHIEELRDALDKASGVSPVVIGVIRERLGHLSSENALRITMTGILNRAARRRMAYGRGIADMSRLVLAALDSAGVLRTRPEDREVRVEWPDPLPTDERTRLANAKAKHELGVPRDAVLAELGYQTPPNADTHTLATSHGAD